tara:strand:+ start:4358 stop:5596 length:1239 start_codon:yes stop_codon:yes gene_type:complete
MKKLIKNTVTTVALACAATLGIAESALAADGKKVVLWHGYRGNEKEALLQVVDKFNEKVKADGYHVKALGIPFDAYADKITAAMPRGKGGDVFIYAQDRLGGWIEGGETVESIDFYVDEEVLDQYIPTTVEAMNYKDVVYGLPLNFKVTTLIYNKALVKTPPKTSDEFVKLAKELTNKPSGQYGLAYEYANYYFHAALQNAFSGRVFEPGPKPVLNSDENIKSLEYLLKWYREDGFLPAEPSGGLVQSMFNSGKAAMVISGPWFLGEIASEIDFGLAMLPTIKEAGNQPMRPWMTVEGVYLAKLSKVQDEGYELVKYLTSPEAGKIMATVGRQTPANKLVYDYDEVSEDEVLMSFRQQVEVAVPMPNLAEMTMVWSPATTAMNKIVKGTDSPKAAMEVAQEEVAKAVTEIRL